MIVKTLPFEKTGYFSSLICDYLRQEPQLKPFYNRFPHIENFADQIQEKAKNYPDANRAILYDSLVSQYRGMEVSDVVRNNLAMLKEPNTFTVVTGHQLNLFTGPLYFIYKIISTINLTVQLKKTYPKYNFVPVYWMATEDHDFEEINHFTFKGKKIQWNRETDGAVGHLATGDLEGVLEVFTSALGKGTNAQWIRDLFEKAYLGHTTLASATRYLVNRLFGAHGLVIVDGDDDGLKKEFVPFMARDIFDRVSWTEVTDTVSALKKTALGYKIQVNPREINFFYLAEGFRKRLVAENGNYAVNGTDRKFSRETLEGEMRGFPKHFSPNVITRPLYQEVVLPNLCYIGGGGELAYWLQLKGCFGAHGITFPMLLLRNSVLVTDQKQYSKLERLGIGVEDVFLEQHSLINKKIREISNIDIDFSPQKELLHDQFKMLYELAGQTDMSFLGAVKAQERKQIKGLEQLEKRLLKAQKRKLQDHVRRTANIQNELFPQGSLQERKMNFSEFYLGYGDRFMTELFEHLDPLKNQFYVLGY